MEAVTNVANAAAEAARAAWGGTNNQAPHQEPISGVKGDVSKGEPFDAGNLDEASQERLTERRAAPVENVPLKSSEGITNQSEGITQQSEVLPSNSGEGITKQSEGITQQPEHAPLQSNEGITAQSEGITKQSEGITKPSEGITSQSEGITKQSEGITQKSEHASPLGHAGAPLSARLPDSSPSSSSRPAENTTESESTSEGTGELYVRTTGLAADGGDFDATKPGAGREADRLMEEKGIHHDESGHDHSSSHDSGKHEGKRGLGERIKAKLHVH